MECDVANPKGMLKKGDFLVEMDVVGRVDGSGNLGQLCGCGLDAGRLVGQTHGVWENSYSLEYGGLRMGEGGVWLELLDRE